MDTLTENERAAASAESFLDELYGLVRQNKKDEAADLLYDHFHDILTACDYEQCRDIFRFADVKKLTTSLMRSFLSLTFRAKEEIWTRPAFFETALAEITRQQDGTRAARLVGHLR
ncbi:hypothetical protein FRUB_02088 [Fimbriiglobus ruber]|uniref:Uncharacterized protein n=2 Tax=Fimbriiglobus ruber TaxID=1908690 RepID=A0A225EBK4_9BACT|nr:hypothetical protein FRUB_02088 [Fimbriiglobus ruber]